MNFPVNVTACVVVAARNVDHRLSIRQATRLRKSTHALYACVGVRNLDARLHLPHQFQPRLRAVHPALFKDATQIASWLGIAIDNSTQVATCVNGSYKKCHITQHANKCLEAPRVRGAASLRLISIDGTVRGRDSAVGIATVRGSNPGVGETAQVQTGPGTHPASYKLGTWSPSRG